MLKSIAVRYFETFMQADLLALRAMFAEKVVLRDWEISANGIDAVLLANEKIFSALSNISVEVVDLYEDGDHVVAELLISADQLSPIRVVDVLTFTSGRKISSIRAYKG